MTVNRHWQWIGLQSADVHAINSRTHQSVFNHVSGMQTVPTRAQPLNREVPRDEYGGLAAQRTGAVGAVRAVAAARGAGRVVVSGSLIGKFALGSAPQSRRRPALLATDCSPSHATTPLSETDMGRRASWPPI